MVSKKILAVAIAAAFSSQAFAVINLNDKDDAGSKLTFAKEALTTNTTVTGNDSGTYYRIGGAANTVLDTKMEYGTGIANTQKRFLRVDLSGAIFTTLSNLSSASANAAGVLVQGGQNKDTYAILEVTATGAVPQAEVVTVNVDELAISGSSNVAITGTVYETLTAAVNQTPNTALNTKNLSSPIKTATGVKVTATPATVTADVNESFKKFVAGSGTTVYQNLGTLAVAVEAGVLDRDTTAAVIGDVIVVASSKVKLAGDFSVGTFSLAAAPASAANCSAGSTLLLNTAKTESTTYTGPNDITLTTIAAQETLCIVAPGDKVIPKGSYTATITFEKVANSAFAPAAQTVAFGTVAHNGTTIQVPYLTTLADYNQRLVLVNRGGADANYTITFTPEAGNTATAKAAATGTLAAGKTTIVKAADVVSLSGNTRTAATINIVAVSGNIDAATTTVNLADKSTDTVKLQ